jgi:endonuclease YncB( thermonuclease family)
MRQSIVVGMVAGVLALGGCGGRAGPPPPANAVVVSVTDGDTIVVRVRGRDEHVRLIGIDTPETVAPTKPVMCFGKEASHETASLLPPGTPVQLVRDVEPRDDYGRLLAYVYRVPDGLFVNLRLAEAGFADALSIAPNTTYAGAFRAAVAAARAARRGLWGACGRFGDPVASPP